MGVDRSAILIYTLQTVKLFDDMIVTNEKWLELSTEFGKQYCTLFNNNITSYLDLFIAHFGDILKRFGGSLERLANFGIENRHKFIKLIFSCSNFHFATETFYKTLFLKCYRWSRPISRSQDKEKSDLFDDCTDTIPHENQSSSNQVLEIYTSDSNNSTSSFSKNSTNKRK
ncbi:hypothetical protein PPL_04164 [Heterostelium album PN500]|uniref:Uncharacterized protein n=1 Tax=Heterostelium pallidum (strain ATCC 26659 / Pp 5 / PN500) TaxID=670386 RepID=D3B673_HETP5|nr:hypothetical protein PPL_04164 [Heterostelium album PN500]EFA83371.1 hypothetical protein PPL_04164 [Heterostelium album PN500]|eukprot:XP_020435488.1 hypothetical protein PPL_04164 [Heterostelium album PN500]